MKKAISLILLLGCFILSAIAQQEYVAHNTNTSEKMSLVSASTIPTSNVNFRFMSVDQSSYINQIDASDAGKHFLGDSIAKKEFLLKKLYSFKEPVAPGSSATKTIYRKPDIYFSVKKIEKYLKEQMKNGILTSEVAKDDFNKVLDVALVVLDEDTESLEHRINSANSNASKLLRIFVDEVELDK